jgi:hypothetical protein
LNLLRHKKKSFGKIKKSQQQKFQEIHNQMARVCSTAKVDREGDDTEATETVPISEAMKRSGLVTLEDAPAAEAEQADVEETDSEDDYSSAVPSKPSHLDFRKSTISEGDLRKMLSLGYLSEAKKELIHFGGEETTPKPGKDEVVIFKSFFKAGLRFPLNKMIADVLKKFIFGLSEAKGWDHLPKVSAECMNFIIKPRLGGMDYMKTSAATILPTARLQNFQ